MQTKLIMAFVVMSLLAAAGGFIKHTIAENERLVLASEQWQGNYNELDKMWKAERVKLKQRDVAHTLAETEHDNEVQTLGAVIKRLQAGGDQCVGAPVPEQLRHYSTGGA